MSNEETLKKFLTGTFKYDSMGQYIWLVEPSGHHQKIADLRGYGAIQNLFKNNKGEVDLDKANSFQDFLGEWLVKTLNEMVKTNEVLDEINDIVDDTAYSAESNEFKIWKLINDLRR